jgi:hypothetical protein
MKTKTEKIKELKKELIKLEEIKPTIECSHPLWFQMEENKQDGEYYHTCLCLKCEKKEIFLRENLPIIYDSKAKKYISKVIEWNILDVKPEIKFQCAKHAFDKFTSEYDSISEKITKKFILEYNKNKKNGGNHGK